MVQDILNNFLLYETFTMVSWATQMDIVCKSYTPKKLTYQLTTLGWTKLLEFHIRSWFLG